MKKTTKLDRMSPEAKIAGLGTKLEGVIELANDLKAKYDAAVALINDLKATLNTHIANGEHVVATSVNASADTSTVANAAVTVKAAVAELDT